MHRHLKYIWVFILLTTLLCNSFSQEKEDSLLNVLQQAKDLEKSRILNEFSDFYYYKGENLQAIQYAEQAFENAKKFKNQKQSLIALNNLTNLEIAEGNYSKGKEWGKEAYALAISLEDKDGEAYICNLLGNANYFTSHYDEALNFWQKSLEIRESQNNLEESATLIMNIGIIHKNKGEYKKAIENNEKALNIHREMGNEDMIARIMANIGNIYFYSGLDYGKALEYYNESLDFFIKQNIWKGEANIYNSIGLVYEKQDSINKALTYFNKSLDIYQKEEYKNGMAQSMNSIGSILLKQNKLQESLDQFYKCLEIFEELGARRDIALTQNDIGSVFTLKKDYRRALRYKLTALKIMDELNAKKEVSDMYKELSDIYSEINDFENAYKYHELYASTKDSLFTSEYTNQISEWRTRYETQKKEQQLELQVSRNREQEADLKRKNVIIYAIFGVILIFVIFSFLLIKQINQKKKAHDKITKQNKEITDNIQYARRIQQAVLPSPEPLHNLIDDHFILFKPRDIVSGDFYWVTVIDKTAIVAAADCTGHGVPGAFMSMLGISFLNEIIKVKKVSQANEVLNELRSMVKTTLAQSGSKIANDGMDISLVMIDTEKNELQFSGAYNHMYLVRDNAIIKSKADRMPIGNYIKEKDSFTNHVIHYKKGDVVYILSDGYPDQFGGENNEKYTSKVLQENFLNLHKEPMYIQQKTFFNNFAKWRGERKQIDDVLLIGMRL